MKYIKYKRLTRLFVGKYNHEAIGKISLFFKIYHKFEPSTTRLFILF